MDPRWRDDAFLDELRGHTDRAADACVAALDVHKDYADLFRLAVANDSVLPDDAPQALREFFSTTDNEIWLEADKQKFPDGLDHACTCRLARGPCSPQRRQP